ncbi:polyprenyl synthetase family protein [Actinopolyspora erythraea]|uniref:Dimethylallyltranstransferase n=1 Tax=Actinopolyspora erythraea TaxID=414996 RepID=A0A099D4R3_9ACTN|nr:family 2 encapsulin nanocompartment cargo protein polyprenyl transferase [Actinopolyspora erythraea]ASU79032.1 polyprenyl synthetase family protein [Actinopolyspora erythraea]KGI81163.1 dimethylallyltranstransferase [Actinopolyspora erythraea]
MATSDVLPHATPDQEAYRALDAARGRVEPALRSALDTLPEDMRHIARYQFGWIDEHGHPSDASGGKALRPALVLLAAEATGGTAEAALPAALAAELVHNFSLLHDDVIDTDATRRHRPTAWTVFGASAAILAGDALLSLAYEVLAGSGHPGALSGIRLLNTTVQELIQGQVTDLAFEQRGDVDVAECQRMAEAKTAALLATSCELGALFAGADQRRTEHLRRFGHDLGLAFQHVDDLLGIWGDPGTTGKPAYSDLHARKKSLPVVFALNSDTSAGQRLGAHYHQPPTSEADLTGTADLVDTAGGRTWSHAQADRLLTNALGHLEAADPLARTDELTALAHLVTRRDH